MAILSITFHIEEKRIEEWNKYVEQNFIPYIQSLNLKYLFSDVDTEMLSEGRNNNLLLFFENQKERENFVNEILPQISQLAMEKFQQDILIFKTLLNSLAKKL